jgi:hypothetical protein|tara:strand:- start:1551 stop:1835 length:285 start_codon:yes stop_codon:yes gene_type:complete
MWPSSNGKERTAEVGDMILQHVGNGDESPTFGRARVRSYTGIVHKITRNKWNHETVFIHWSNGRPPRYYEEHGYPSMNVHNLRKDFDIIKAKSS